MCARTGSPPASKNTLPLRVQGPQHTSADFEDAVGREARAAQRGRLVVVEGHQEHLRAPRSACVDPCLAVLEANVGIVV